MQTSLFKFFVLLSALFSSEVQFNIWVFFFFLTYSCSTFSMFAVSSFLCFSLRRVDGGHILFAFDSWRLDVMTNIYIQFVSFELS